jgi:hypothetical protein
MAVSFFAPFDKNEPNQLQFAKAEDTPKINFKKFSIDYGYSSVMFGECKILCWF